jgi:dienelactone hydrolase
MSNNYIETARQIVTQLSQGDFVGAWQHAERSVRERFSAEQLRAGWQGVEAQAGAFKGQVRTHSTASPQGEIVVVTCVFGTINMDINVVFNAEDQVIGLTITPTGTIDQQLAAHESVPAYVNKDLFHEQEVVVGRGEWKLPGTLSLPVGDGPFPAVVLVHGSGPNDRDETLGPNKPFRDLAWGLASQGIAILRYEKRTRAHGPRIQEHLDRLTIQEEVIDDALEAVALLQSVPQVDTRHIFVLGHSLGGYVLPLIGKADAEIAGLIVLAGLARPLEDTILDQFTYIYSLDGTITPEHQNHLNEVKRQAAQVKSPDLSPETPSATLPFGVPAAYWLALRGYRPEEIAKTLPQPLLILQGESDYQVTMEDFQIWKDALAERKDVQFKRYPTLSHLFMPVEGGSTATPASYATPGHVAEEVVQDIAVWIKQQNV